MTTAPATPFHRAELWVPASDGAVDCRLCAFRCHIPSSQVGICQVRRNVDGVLYSLNYHAVTACHVDPVEKKPLFHFLPGSRTLSLACAGCNFRCSFCQNWQISQSPRLDRIAGQSVPPQQMVQAALDQGCRSIAYTYTEPTVFMEYAADCGRLAVDRGLRNVFVSNGFFTLDAIEFARPWLHAANIDLKAFSDDTYRSQTGAKLAPVLESLEYLVHRTDIWVEITTLIIPGVNDSDNELSQIARFIASRLRPTVPWHLSRFHPDYRMTDREPTQPDTIERAIRIGRDAGLHHVYAGNLWGHDSESTACHVCGHRLVTRRGYSIVRNEMRDGDCPTCRQPVAGVFE